MLTSYEITYADGSKSRTNMAAQITLTDAEKYYIGHRVDLGVYPVERMVEAVAVTELTTLGNGRVVKRSRLPNGALGACMEDGLLMTTQEWVEFCEKKGMATNREPWQLGHVVTDTTREGVKKS